MHARTLTYTPGREDLLLPDLVAKYGPEPPAYSTYSGARSPQGIQSRVDNSPMARSGAGGLKPKPPDNATNPFTASSPAPTPVPERTPAPETAPAALGDQGLVRARIEAMYAHYDPERLQDEASSCLNPTTHFSLSSPTLVISFLRFPTTKAPSCAPNRCSTGLPALHAQDLQGPRRGAARPAGTHLRTGATDQPRLRRRVRAHSVRSAGQFNAERGTKIRPHGAEPPAAGGQLFGRERPACGCGAEPRCRLGRPPARTCHAPREQK